eukprot:1138503-Pelagomonas_calceolata.AAC.2
MTQALGYAINSAILDTEATATFMLLPASGKLIVTNPYQSSSLLTRILAASSGPFQKVSSPVMQDQRHSRLIVSPRHITTHRLKQGTMQPSSNNNLQPKN